MEENNNSIAAMLYPDCAAEEKERGSFYGPCSYQPILDSFGKIILQKDDHGYSGDSRVLYQTEQGIGYLQFGWGSCSGCDVLQACDHISEIDTLISQLRDGIKWFASPAEALAYFNEHDWGGDYSWHADEQKEFIEQAKTLLFALITPPQREE